MLKNDVGEMAHELLPEEDEDRKMLQEIIYQKGIIIISHTFLNELLTFWIMVWFTFRGTNFMSNIIGTDEDTTFFFLQILERIISSVLNVMS